jgi:hypothetical protein
VIIPGPTRVPPGVTGANHALPAPERFGDRALPQPLTFQLMNGRSQSAGPGRQARNTPARTRPERLTGSGRYGGWPPTRHGPFECRARAKHARRTPVRSSRRTPHVALSWMADATGSGGSYSDGLCGWTRLRPAWKLARMSARWPP